jgi:hypothetical protein
MLANAGAGRLSNSTPEDTDFRATLMEPPLRILFFKGLLGSFGIRGVGIRSGRVGMVPGGGERTAHPKRRRRRERS